MDQIPDPNAAPTPDYSALGALPEPGEGNFKRGKWIAPVVLVVLAAGIGGALFLVHKKDKESMKPEQAAKLKEDIFLKPRK